MVERQTLIIKMISYKEKIDLSTNNSTTINLQYNTDWGWRRKNTYNSIWIIRVELIEGNGSFDDFMSS